MPPDLNVPEGMLHGSAPAFGGRRLTTPTDASPSLASKSRHFRPHKWLCCTVQQRASYLVNEIQPAEMMSAFVDRKQSTVHLKAVLWIHDVSSESRAFNPYTGNGGGG